jgi:hypothetical protein
MTKAEYFEYHADCVTRMTAITKAKNADYTGGGDNPFANFTRVEGLGICSTEQGFLTRMTDKLCRLASFAQKGTFQVKDESVEDTLLDLANYCILMAGYLKSKRPAEPTTASPPYSYTLSVTSPMSYAQVAAEKRAP